MSIGGPSLRMPGAPPLPVITGNELLFVLPIQLNGQPGSTLASITTEQLGLFAGSAGLPPAPPGAPTPSNYFLNSDHQWAVPSGVSFSTTPPAAPQTGDAWFNLAQWQINVWDAGYNQWAPFGSQITGSWQPYSVGVRPWVTMVGAYNYWATQTWQPLSTVVNAWVWPSAPDWATPGAFWYDTNAQQLRVYNAFDAGPTVDSNWSTAVATSATAPVNARRGDLWFSLSDWNLWIWWGGTYWWPVSTVSGGLLMADNPSGNSFTGQRTISVAGWDSLTLSYVFEPRPRPLNCWLGLEPLISGGGVYVGYSSGDMWLDTRGDWTLKIYDAGSAAYPPALDARYTPQWRWPIPVAATGPTAPTLGRYPPAGATMATGSLYYDNINALQLRVYNGTNWTSPTPASAYLSPPANPQIGDLWFDTDDWTLYIWPGSYWTPSYPTVLFNPSQGSSGGALQVNPMLWDTTAVRYKTVGATILNALVGNSTVWSFGLSLYPGNMWLDTDTNEFKVYDGTNWRIVATGVV